ncbi:hypothetical protein HAU15_10200 [Weissella confusa]|nr:hypothetical protein [Weissella confusa]
MATDTDRAIDLESIIDDAIDAERATESNFASDTVELIESELAIDIVVVADSEDTPFDSGTSELATVLSLRLSPISAFCKFSFLSFSEDLVSSRTPTATKMTITKIKIIMNPLTLKLFLNLYNYTLFSKYISSTKRKQFKI